MPLKYLVKSIRNNISILLLIFIWSFKLSAQQQEFTPKPIIELLKIAEKRFDVRFSYNRRDIKDINCQAVISETSLETTLEQLSLSCGIKFYRIDQRYIAIQLSSNPDISICATLIDQATGEPLKGAAVIANNIQIQTNSGGRFYIESIPENARISIYHQGFKVKELIAGDLAGDVDCPIIFTEEKFNYLPTVLVSNYLTSGINKNTEGSIAISNSGFEILPSLIEPDVLKIAQILPGIESYAETASDINIRGGKSDESLLLWDDIRMYQSGHFFGLISAFNPNLTKNVTIYKNGTHPRFGESVSGVISMKSDNEIPEQFTGAASIDFISTQFYAKIPAAESLAFHVSGRTSINTGIGNPVYKQFFNRVFQNTVVTNFETETSQGLRSTDEAFNFYDISLKGIWQLSKKDRVQYSFLTIFNKLSFIERFTAENSLTKNESELKQRTLVNGLSWERDWSSKFSSKATFNGNAYINNGGNQNVDTGSVQSLRNEVNERALKLDLFYSFSSNFSLNGGYQYTDTEIINTETPFESNEITTVRDVLYSNAFFLNSQLKLFNKNTILSAGLRHSHYPNLSVRFTEPRINLFQRLTSNLSLTASAELKHQAIIQNSRVQNTLLGIETQGWIILDGSSAPILESEQISIGGTFKKNKWNFGIEGFYKKVEGINSANQGFRNQLINVNTIGSYTVKGIEGSISRKTKKLNVWVSYTFMNNNYIFDALNPSEFRSNFDINHSVSVAASYSWRSFLFSLGTNYHSGIPFTAPVTDNEIVSQNGTSAINFDQVNRETLKEFFRADFSATYTTQLDKTFAAKLSLGLLNLFDRKNAIDTYYILDYDTEGNPFINRVEQFSLGFTPNISFQLLF